MSEMTRTEELLALAEAATPGPWNVVENAADGKDEAWCYWHKVGPIWFQGVSPDKNSTFIAAANPSTIKQLVALCRLQHEALDGLHMCIDPRMEESYDGVVSEIRNAIEAFNKFEQGEE